MSHKSGHIIVRLAATAPTDLVKNAEVELDVSHMSSEEVAALTKKVHRKLEKIADDDGHED